MRIGEVAKQAGVTTRTIRFYESVGLIPRGARVGGGHHYYTDETVARLQKIDQLKALGLSLDEIVSVINLYFTDPSGKKPKVEVLAILRRHLRDAEQRAASLEHFCTELRTHIERFEAWLEQHSDAIRREDDA